MVRVEIEEHLRHLSEEELLRRAAQGDQAACAAVYQQYVRAIYRLAYGVLLDERDAEEVVQDSFAYALQNLRHFDARRSAFRTWLYTITMSRCRNKRRRKWLPTLALADSTERLPSRDTPPERAVEESGVRDSVLAALRRLSPKLREAVVLRYFDGLSYREMAEVLGCPQKTAESRVRVAHETLYKLLAGQREALLDGVLSHDAAR
jgi:RNA polymerase sigma-70 factor (ECF subfamily)